MVLILQKSRKYTGHLSKSKPKLTADVKMQMEQQIKANSLSFFSRPLRYPMSLLTVSRPTDGNNDN